jgi:DNA-binding SARP family transcriptional activator/Tfp pilus assembly protein PilF
MQFGILGPLMVTDGGVQLRLRSPNQRALLALLLCHENQVVPSEQLVEAIWGPDPPPGAARNLVFHVHRLRRLLGADSRVVNRPPGYALVIPPGELDVNHFERLAEEGRQARSRGHAEQAAELLRAALCLWRGPALVDAGDLPRLRQHAAYLEERRLAILEERIEADLALGRHAALVAELAGLVAQHPFRERFLAQLMLALYRAGRQAEALEAYRIARRLFAEELGLEPSAGLRELEHWILVEDPSLDIDGIASATVPPASAELPPGVSAFVGRHGEITRLTELLTPPRRSVAIVGIDGPAGVGKSALAIHTAHLLAPAFPDGQLFVNLHGYASGPATRPLQALARMLRSLGVEAEKVPVEVEEASALFRSLLAGKRMLVALDDARSADQVRPLLPGTPGCVVLITSRDRLTGLVAIDGAHRLTLDVLSADEAVSLLARVLGHDRATAEPEAVSELAQVCAYLPLALRIAAANLTCKPDQSVAGYVAALRGDDRLTALEVGGDPQAAVRVAFDRSYRWLAPDAQRLFRLVGLVPGPAITAPAAAALAGIPAELAGRVLDQLAGAHLLEHAAPGRFAFHDLLRLYARERAEQQEDEPERQSAIRRLLGWYLHGADAAAGLLYPGTMRLPLLAADPQLPPAGFDDHAGALAWLTAEWDNLVAAITSTAQHGQRQLAWLLADTLRLFFWIHRNTIDWLAVATASLTAAKHGGDQRAQAAAELSLGDAHQCTGRYPQAIQHYSTAFDLARQAGWVEAQAAILSNLGLVHGDLGDLDQAIEHHTTALGLYRRIGRRKGEANALGNLGNLHWELGALYQAADHQNQALALERQIGSRGGEAISLGNLGEVAQGLGRLDEAVEHLTRALALHREIGDRYGEAYALSCLAAVHADEGRTAHALGLAQAALALAREIGERRAEAEAHNTLGSVHLQLGRPAQALDHYRQALSLSRETGTTYAETRALLGLAAVDRHAGHHTRALDHALQALAFAGKVGYRMLQGQAYTTLAAAHLDLGDHDTAIEHARQALSVHRQTGYRLGHAQTLVVLGHALRHQDTEAARSCWREALALFGELGSPDTDQIRALLSP